MPFMMLPAAPGTCPICATAHVPEQPHNAQSFPYGVWFLAEHKRGVTWADAIAHCDKDVKKDWTRLLKQGGYWTEPKDGKPIATVANPAMAGKMIPLPGTDPVEVKCGRHPR